MSDLTTTPGSDGGRQWSKINEATELDVMTFLANNTAKNVLDGTYVIHDMATLASLLIERYNIEMNDE
jgi:hypothetical protein